MLPRISVVTPSFNQAPFLERTIRSVLDQGYGDVEYIIVDGGSTDGSIDIIRRYANRLAYWVSEPDRGQADAINKGLQKATGEWLAWQNSDDLYYPGSFAGLARAALEHPRARLIAGNMAVIDTQDRRVREMRYVRPTYAGLRAEGMILTNQAAFWHRQVHQRIGYLNESLSCAFDYDWFLRVAEQFEGWHVNEVWGGLRIYEATKSQRLAERFAAEMEEVRRRRPFPEWKVPFYRAHRALLMLLRGDVRYVASGIADRLRNRLTGISRKV
jgi:glycosyltransferase involved in cell wall biosynthesis